jgi:hypothetical protein
MVAGMSRASRSDWPIVVGGCPRSGTSLLRRILDCHSRIRCGPEVKFFSDLNGDGPDRLRYLRFLATVRTMADDAALLEILGGALVALHERAALAAGKARWVDKAPENIRYASQWQQLLGDQWLMIHVLRNPLDTIASMIEAQFPDVPSEPMACVAHYCAYSDAAARFAAEHPDRYRSVVYEQLVTQPESTLEGLMRWLGEELEPPQLAFNDRPHDWGLEDQKVIQTTGVHSASVHSWRGRLSLEEAELIWDLTAETWTSFDPERRFVDPPAEPRDSTVWPPSR